MAEAEVSEVEDRSIEIIQSETTETVLMTYGTISRGQINMQLEFQNKKRERIWLKKIPK